MNRILPFLAAALLTAPAQAQATWQQLTDCPGAGRFWGAATGNSTVAIAGTGRLQFSGLNNTVADMWLYEAATDTWSAIPDYPGGVREGADAFTIGDRLFVGFGTPFIQFTTDLYEFIPATQSWVQMPSVPGLGFAYSHGFVVGNTYYIGPENSTGQVYAFNADTDSWSTVASFPGQDRRAQCAFSANGKGYLGMGAFVFGGALGDWWEYDPAVDVWAQVANMTPLSDQSTATQVNNVGFVFNVGANLKDLYAYDAPTDQWVFQSTMPTDRIANGTLFTIGTQGYLIFGEKPGVGGNITIKELWRFTPSTVGMAEGSTEAGVQVAALPDGRVELRHDGPFEGPRSWELYDAQGRRLRRTELGPGMQARMITGPEDGRGLRIAVLRIGERTGVARFIIP